jgi:hypothetical protein
VLSPVCDANGKGPRANGCNKCDRAAGSMQAHGGFGRNSLGRLGLPPPGPKCGDGGWAHHQNHELGAPPHESGADLVGELLARNSAMNSTMMKLSKPAEKHTTAGGEVDGGSLDFRNIDFVMQQRYCRRFIMKQSLAKQSRTQ